MSDKPATDRRSFLKWAGFGAAGTVTAVASSQTAKADETENLDGSARYLETDHVKKVYKLARF